MSNSVCANCGQSIMEGDAFCLNCGIRIPSAQQGSVPCFSPVPSMSMPLGQQAPQPQPSFASAPPSAVKDDFCSGCGAPVREDWLYCMNCGRKLESAPDALQARFDYAAAYGSPHFNEPDSVTNDGFGVESQPELWRVPIGSDSNPVQPTTTRVVSVEGFSSSFSAVDQIDFGTISWDKTEAGFDADEESTSLYTEENEDDDVPTMIYQEEVHPVCTLTRLSTGERFVLDLPAVIGRGSKATVRISNNPYIGRQHVRVLEQDGEVYVEDLKSANHSYVNGQMLSSDQGVKLADGDVLALAKEEFGVSIA